MKFNVQKFVKEWKDGRYEKSETQTFYNKFFEVFGRRRKMWLFMKKQFN